MTEREQCVTVGTGPDWSFILAQGFEEKLQAHWSKMLWSAFRQYIPAGSSLLEIGCGSGKICVQASEQLGARAVGIDVSQHAVEYARGLATFVGTAVDCFVASGFALPFADESFDVVLSDGVIEHFPPDLTSQMVAEHARLCRVGGRVLISVPNLLNLPLTYYKLLTGENFHSYPERGYTVLGLARLMRRHGLKPIAYSGFAPMIGLEWYILKCLRLRCIDRIAPNWLLSLIGYEVLIAAEKQA